jgi:hypothetical protein
MALPPIAPGGRADGVSLLVLAAALLSALRDA